MMHRFGVLFNPLLEASVQLSFEVADWLRLRGCTVWRGTSQGARADPPLPDNIELIIALGGDGTVLRAARLAIEYGSIPVLPVALGRLNFMADISPADLYAGLEMLMDGAGWHDKRTLLDATIYHRHAGSNPPQHMLALNEILLARGEINRVIIVDVEIYEAHLTSYHADGVIVATATGSTAYALAAGGPIIDPRSRALALVPVAGHLTNLPSLVLHEDAVVTLRVRSRHPAAFSADGRLPVAIHEGDEVMVRRAKQTCIFARVRPQSDFYSRMTLRLRRGP
jgi:NAD+ kinase